MNAVFTVPVLRWALLALLLTAVPPVALPQSLPDKTLAEIRFDQRLNASISLDLPFRDEAGRSVRLRDYFGSKPVVLVLGYYECPMLCTLVLNGFIESASDMKWSIGREFDVLDVSVNPKETPILAAAKKRTYLKRYGRSRAAAGWHFLTGEDKPIEELARQVGFHYAYDPASKEYAHPSGLVVLTPEGKVSGYLFGVTFAPKDLAAALRTASSEQVGSPIQQLILLCFHYNPITGKYSGTIIGILRVLGVLTILGVIGMVIALIRFKSQGKRPTLSGEAPAPTGQSLPQAQS
jgi:protein SCO1/2